MYIKNWGRFQHYRDRNPPWIRLHKDLINNIEFNSLSDGAARLLFMCWLLAAEDKFKAGNLPDFQTLAWRLRLDEAKAAAYMDELMDSNFIEDGFMEPGEEPNKRKMTDKLREEIYIRDGRKCKWCGSTLHREIDHIIPVSQGGASEPDNLQVLCRSCNRKKRVKTGKQARDLAAACRSNMLQKVRASRSLETETEADAESEAKSETDHRSPGGDPPVSDFDRFWNAYPRKVGKKAAKRRWDLTKKERPDLDHVLHAVHASMNTEQWRKDGGKFVPHPATWLNEGRWDDVLVPVGSTPKPTLAQMPFEPDPEIHRTPEEQAEVDAARAKAMEAIRLATLGCSLPSGSDDLPPERPPVAEATAEQLAELERMRERARQKAETLEDNTRLTRASAEGVI